MEVSGAEPVKVEHVSGQQHLCITEEVYDHKMTIKAVKTDNTGLQTEIRADYLDDVTITLSDFSIGDHVPDSTLPSFLTN